MCCQSSLYLSLVAQMVKTLAAVQEIWIWSLGQEDPLEEGMATHSSILAWEIPWTEESGRLWSMGSQGVRHNLKTKTKTTASLVIFDICRYTEEESRERCFGEGLTHTKLHVIFSLKARPPDLPAPNQLHPITSRTNHENSLRDQQWRCWCHWQAGREINRLLSQLQMVPETPSQSAWWWGNCSYSLLEK